MAATARTAAPAIRKAADFGWQADRYLNFAAASVKMAFEPAGAEKSKGVISLAVYKEPMSQRWGRDPEVLTYLDLPKTHAPDVGESNGSGVSGFLCVALMAHVLQAAGDDLSRAMGNSPQNLHVVDSFQPVRFNGRELDTVGDVIKVR